MDPRQRVKAYIDRNGIANPERIRRALSNGKGGPVRTSVIREVLAQVSGQPLPTAPSPTSDVSLNKTTPSKIKTRTLSEFRSQHDYALKLKRAIADLGSGYVNEHEMKAAAGVPNHVWRRYADLPEFQHNKLKLREVTYWAAPRVIEEMKEIVGPL